MMDWYLKVILVISVILAGVLLSGCIIAMINYIVEEQCGLTNKRKDKYFKNKKKQIIEQLEFEKGIYVRKVKIENKLYRYVFKTTPWDVYPQLFETLYKLVEHIEKLEKEAEVDSNEDC